jgi:hypothetical protein
VLVFVLNRVKLNYVITISFLSILFQHFAATDNLVPKVYKMQTGVAEKA